MGATSTLYVRVLARVLLWDNSRNEEDNLHNKMITPNNNSSDYAQMWAAKYFGIYHKDSTGVKPGNIYFGYGDMNINKFDKKEFEKDKPCSGLDHENNVNPNLGIQDDGFNCGIWVLMEMWNRRVDGNTDRIGPKSKEDLKGYRLGFTFFS